MGDLADAAKLFGDPDEWPVEEAPERLKLLSQTATQFLRAGGSVTLVDFSRLSLTERAVLAACADALRGVDKLSPESDVQRALASFMERNK